MIVMLNPKHNQQLLAQSLAELGVTAYPAGANRVMIAGNDADLANRLAQLPEVLEVVPVARPYPLASREFQQEDTVIQVRDVVIGGSKPVVMAGPCSVESVENIVDIAKAVKRLGGHVLRGGAFKPRSSPYSFQGH